MRRTKTEGACLLTAENKVSYYLLKLSIPITDPDAFYLLFFYEKLVVDQRNILIISNNV